AGGRDRVRLAHPRTAAPRLHLWRSRADRREALELADQHDACLAFPCRRHAGAGAIIHVAFSVTPPSTTSSMPVTYFDSSDARYSAALATSQASPMCPIGTCASRARHIASTSPAE